MEHEQQELHAVVDSQRAYFRTGATLPVGARIEALKKLKAAVIKNEKRLEEALQKDLGRTAVEAYLCDIGPTVTEINETIRGLRRWAKPETHFSGLMCFPSITTKVYKMPYGVTLIISPFNFPVLLTLGVLAASIAGGNTAVLKTSSKSSHCTLALKELIAECFAPSFVTLIDGGHETADRLLAERFDKIFYTGSPAVGKHVLAAAADKLTPVALELGGETGNWAIVRADADLHDAARKIAFFKLCNAGQICINVNQIAVAEEVAEPFVEALCAEFRRQIGNAVENPEYPVLISDAAYGKCARLAEEYKAKTVFGGQGDPKTRRFSPTVLYPIPADDPIVQKELFCPLLPVVPFADGEVGTLLSTIAEREHPLALYLFTKDKKWAKRVMQTMQYGGGCVNEVCVHLMVKGVPFGGTGHSGMGAYHGVWGFREFTHPSTVLYGKTHGNLSLREHPYKDEKLRFLRIFEK